MVDPATAMLIASAVATTAGIGGQVASSKKQKKANKKQQRALEHASKRRAKETKAETKAGLLEDALKRSVELEAHRLHQGQKLAKNRSGSMQDTADLVRGAFNI